MSVCLRPARPWAGSRETSIPKVAVGLSDDTSARVGRTQLTMTFARRQLTDSQRPGKPGIYRLHHVTYVNYIYLYISLVYLRRCFLQGKTFSATCNYAYCYTAAVKGRLRHTAGGGWRWIRPQQSRQLARTELQQLRHRSVKRSSLRKQFTCSLKLYTASVEKKSALLVCLKANSIHHEPLIGKVSFLWHIVTVRIVIHSKCSLRQVFGSPLFFQTFNPNRLCSFIFSTGKNSDAYTCIASRHFYCCIKTLHVFYLLRYSEF